MASKRKRRAPGAGRKPNDPSGPGTPFAVRMPEDLRNQLRAVADERGSTLSGEVLRLLRFALDESTARRNRPRELQALFFLIEMLAKDIGRDLPGGWLSSPYAFGAFRGGVSRFLDELRPPGEVTVPPDAKRDPVYQWPANPEEVGESVAGFILGVSRFFEAEGGYEASFGGILSPRDDTPDNLREYYNSVRAIRDLKLKRGEK